MKPRLCTNTEDRICWQQAHLDEDPVLTVMDAVTNQTANAAGVNLHTSPLHTTHSNMTDHRYIITITVLIFTL